MSVVNSNPLSGGLVNMRLARLASVKHGRNGRGWTTRFDYEWANHLGTYRLTGTVRRWPACLTVNGVGEPCAGEPHARFEAAAGGNHDQSGQRGRTRLGASRRPYSWAFEG